MIRHYSRQTITEPIGPITVVSGKSRRLTFFECGNDLNSMIDCAKISDLVLLVIDGNFGFEMVSDKKNRKKMNNYSYNNIFKGNI